jgi:hypothetical protein
MKIDVSLSGGRIDPKEFDKLDDLVDRNFHSEAYAAAARLARLPNLEKIFKHIEGIKNVLRHTPETLQKYEREVLEDLRSYAKSNMHPDDFKKFRSII